MSSKKNLAAKKLQKEALKVVKGGNNNNNGNDGVESMKFRQDFGQQSGGSRG